MTTNLSLKTKANELVIDNIIYHSLARNTWLAYQKGWRKFESYCQQTSQVSLPASVETVIGFLTYLSNKTHDPLSVGSIILYRSAIQKTHELSGYTSPTRDAKVGQIISGIKRMLGTAPKRVNALSNTNVKQMMRKCSDTILGKRDAAILALGFAAALRRSEICSIKVEDIEIIKPTSSSPIRMTVTIKKSKTDQESKGQKIAIIEGRELKPISTVLRWLEAANIKKGYLFQSLYKGGRLRGNPMHHSDIPRIIKHYARLVGLETNNIAGHSLRAGFVTCAVKHGARIDKIMQITRHKSAQSVLYYIRDNDLFVEHAGLGFL